jgi:hypothetical protein
MSSERVNRLVGNEGEHDIEMSLIEPRTRSSIMRQRECWGSCYAKQNILALKPRSSLQGGGNRSHTSLVELAEEFVDDEVDVVTSRFPQLTSVSREKIYYPPLAPTT